MSYGGAGGVAGAFFPSGGTAEVATEADPPTATGGTMPSG